MTARNFVYISFGTLIIAMTAIGVFNYKVDPFDLYHQPKKKGLNYYKYGFQHFTRVCKPLKALEIKPEVILLGSSRMEYLAPDSLLAATSGKRVYNFGLLSGTAYEMSLFLKFAIDHFNITEVYYAVDFISVLNYTPRVRDGFNKRLLMSDMNPVMEKLSLAFSYTGLKCSIRTIQYNYTDREGHTEKFKFQYNKFGSRTGRWAEIQLSQRGDLWLKEQFDTTITQYVEIYNKPRLSFDIEKLKGYKNIINDCKKRGIKYIPFVLPIHELQLRLLIKTPAFDLYKKFLIFLAENGGFYYFGGINEYTSNNNNFWDTQHVRKTIAPEIFKYIIDGATSESAVWGQFYNEQNIDELIVNLERLQ